MRTVQKVVFFAALTHLALCVLFWSSSPQSKQHECESIGQFLLEPIGMNR